MKQSSLAADLVKRQFTATGINQLWVADMTYVPTWVGFLYLAVVVDVYSRKVVGWAFGERMTSDLVVAALNMVNRPGYELTPKSWTVAVPPTKRYFSAGTPPG